MPNTSSEIHEQYAYLEIQKGTTLNVECLKEIETFATEAEKNSKKLLLSLPPKFKVESARHFSSLLSFLKKKMGGKMLFVPQESLKWSKEWGVIVDSGFWVAQRRQAIAWATAQKLADPRLDSIQFGKISYLKFSGSYLEKSPKFSEVISRYVGNIKGASEITLPSMVQHNGFSVWSFLDQALVIDVSHVTAVGRGFIAELKKVFEKHQALPALNGIYFLTSENFHSWLFKYCLGVKKLNEVGNIVRVMPERDKEYANVLESEVKALSKVCREQEFVPALFTLQVQGATSALQAISDFYPDIVIVDSMSDVDALKEKLPDHLQEKVYHVTPATDAGLMILGPQLITQGYDFKLFAEYLLSRFKNNHGSPNETFIYYLNTRPEHMKKVTSFFMYEFHEILKEKEKALLEQIASCETDGEKQGNFLISLLQQRILSLDIDLPLTSQGISSFLSNYSRFFPHHRYGLCDSLRLFFKGDPLLKMVRASLRLIHDYNELKLKQEGFWLEAQFQERQATLTIKSNPDEKLEKRCFSLFALLNGSDIFNDLNDKEILISIISLMWENYNQSARKQQQGFLINLLDSKEHVELKVFQSEHNRILLKEKSNGKLQIQFIGDFPFHRNTQREIFKFISMFFKSQEPQQKSWQFACYEAASQTFANCSMEQMVSIDLSIDGDRWGAIFLSSSKEPNTIAPRSQKTIESGAHKIDIAPNGRRISIILNPSESDLQQKPEATGEIEKELAELKEDAILEQVEKEKKKEAVERSKRLQGIYDEALKAYSQKYGYEDEAGDTQQIKVKTLESAGKPKLLAGKKMDAAKARKIKYIVLSTLSVLFIGIVLTLLCLFNMTTPPQGEGLLLTDSESSRYQPVPFVPQSHVVAETKVELPLSPSREMVSEINFRINLEVPPGQDELNAMLKTIFFAPQDFKECGDLHNLYGRLFLYKIYLDREKGFEKEQIEKWFGEAYQAFNRAEEKYEMKKYRSSMNIWISDWKPERGWYEESKKSLLYDTWQEALLDMQKMKKNMYRLKEQMK